MTPGPEQYPIYEISAEHFRPFTCFQDIGESWLTERYGVGVRLYWPADAVGIAEADRVKELIARVPEMVDLLRGIEWRGVDCLCPCCGWGNHHAPDCRLHAILKLAEDASNGQ